MENVSATVPAVLIGFSWPLTVRSIHDRGLARCLLAFVGERPAIARVGDQLPNSEKPFLKHL
jgi:hypothetical protein